MRLSRMLGITTALLSHENVTAKKLAQQYEVSVRTIYRDIEALSEAGVPVYMRQGRGGGISLMEDYTVSRAILSDEEAQHLILALQAMGATNFSDNRILIDKIKSIFKKGDTSSWVEIEFANWSNTEREKTKFFTIKNALHESHVLEIEYITASGQRGIRDICPIKVIFKSRAWYLSAYCLKRKDMRLFRLSRIIKVRNTHKNFDPSSLPEEKLWEGKWEQDIISLHLRFKPNALYRLYDEFDEDMLEINPDGSIDVKVCYPRDEWVYSFILSLGDSVEVISPHHIRSEILRRTLSMAAKYK